MKGWQEGKRSVGHSWRWPSEERMRKADLRALRWSIAETVLEEGIVADPPGMAKPPAPRRGGEKAFSVRKTQTAAIWSHMVAWETSIYTLSQPVLFT